MKSKYMLHITVLKNSSWLQHQGFWSFCDLDYGCISCICVQFPIISRNCHKAMYHNRNLKPCSILNTMVSTKYRRWETNQQLAGSTCSTNDQNSIFEIASYNRKKQKKKNHHQNIQCLSMESIPNIYTMVPYLDRVQISKFHIFRYFFRPIADTK